MAKHLEIGAIGEQLAQAFLEGKGYQILKTNWRYKRAEVDIIAKNEATLVFVEVKTRSSDAFGKPEEFFTRPQERRLIAAAAAYMAQTEYDWAIRFDVISIIFRSEQDFDLEHFEDAFFPGLE